MNWANVNFLPVASRLRICVGLGLTATLITAIVASACGGDAAKSTPTPSASTPTASPAPGTPAPSDPQAAIAVFQRFVDAVTADKLEEAWSMYAASIAGTKDQHEADYGCDFGAFSFEFPSIQNMFDRVAPLEVLETFNDSPGSLSIEMRAKGADGSSFLVTVVRVKPDEEYRMRFMNSGAVSIVPGAPDPLPSPGEPIGACGIWAGAR